MRAPRVDTEVLSAGVATYLVLGLMWALAYFLAASLLPNAFALAGDTSASAPLDGFRALYFSFVTLCTLGYGDVVPAHPVVQMLAVVEAIMGVLYLSILIARLVTLCIGNRESLTNLSLNPAVRCRVIQRVPL